MGSSSSTSQTSNAVPFQIPVARQHSQPLPPPLPQRSRTSTRHASTSVFAEQQNNVDEYDEDDDENEEIYQCLPDSVKRTLLQTHDSSDTSSEYRAFPEPEKERQ